MSTGAGRILGRGGTPGDGMFELMGGCVVDTPKEVIRTLWSEPGDLRVGPVARVALLTAVDKEYSYTVPDELARQVEPGRRLVVPFGRRGRQVVAFCVSVADEPWTSTLRPVAEVLDDQRLLSDALLELGRWIARYYCCPLGRTLSAMVPAAIRVQSGFRTVRTCRLVPTGEEGGSGGVRRSARRRAVLELLAAHPAGLAIEDVLAGSGASRAVVTALAKAGVVEIRTHREPAPAPDFDRPGTEPTFKLNAAQRTAVERIAAVAAERRFRAVLLFGVSGSGKTEVYVHAVRGVLAAGRQAILLVPEIALTTQIVERLTSRFHDVAVIHSGLTGVQRSLTWAAIARGEKRVVIGTRSAIFAPCPDLGLIVVDEEQEGSYKNLQAPRFHTRDVAIKRAQLAGVPVVLGSATPSLETWYNCDRYRHFERLRLPARISGLPMPAVEFVDLRMAQGERKGVHLLSEPMERAIERTLDAGQQAVLLLNRRGYANYLMCSRCRHPVLCPRCQVNMVFHQATGMALCHYCQSKIPVPSQCEDSSCRGKLVRWGMGTQRVEEELRVKFPQARIARADSDTMLRSEHYQEMIRAFSERQTDILVGTQMIAKGLDFPAVAFVGVVNADTSLAIPDFRASERTFQLITQVAGRAGRSEEGGRVVVQSLAGVVPALRFAIQHDYEGFARHELGIRRQLSWPPFSRLARVVISHTSRDRARAEANELARGITGFLAEHKLAGQVLGPQSAPLARLRNLYRFDLLIQTADASRLLETMEALRHNDVLKPSGYRVMVDVDPVSLL